MPRSTRYKTIKLDLAGSSNENRSDPISIQRTLNFYPEITDPGGINRTVLHGWPNFEIEDIDPVNGTDRGMYEFLGDMYQVFNDKLYRYEAADLDNPNQSLRLTRTEIGTIPNVSSRCGLSDNGVTMVITNGSTPHSWDGTTFAALPITFNPKNVQFLNDRFVFDGDDIVDGTSSRRFFMSDVESTTVDVANSAYPRSKPDQFIGPYVYDQIMYFYGAKTIEPWESNEGTLPPAARINGGIIETLGVCNPFIMTNTENAMYFISNRSIPYRVVSFQPERIGTVGVEKAFRTYDLDQAHAKMLVRYNQNFIVWTFRADARTWVYSESTGSWFELSSGQPSGSSLPRYTQGQYTGSSFLDIFNKTYVADHQRHQLFSLTDEIQLIPDDAIRERILPVIAGDTFGEPGTLLEMSKLRISMECCVGLNTTSSLDNIDNPILMISFSTDGENFGTEIWKRIGRIGENKVIEIHKVKQFRRLYIKLKISDRGEFHLYDASIDIRQAGY